MLCRRISIQSGHGSVPVYLNVYDLTSINGYAYWLGLGAYHSGVQVHGVEYAFGGHEYSSTGIFEGEPKQCDGFTFRKSVLMGWTDMSLEEVREFMEKFARDYRGDAYNVIAKNCNHFCNDVCIKLTGNPIPSWVNRLARFGMLCNCIIPENLNSVKGSQQRIKDKSCEEEKMKLRQSNEFPSSSNSLSSSRVPPPSALTGGSRSINSLLPYSP